MEVTEESDIETQNKQIIEMAKSNLVKVDDKKLKKKKSKVETGRPIIDSEESEEESVIETKREKKRKKDRR